MATTLDDLIPRVAQRLSAQHVNPEAYGTRKGFPRGIMLHYDGSTGADKWAVGWFLDPACGVGYDIIVLDNGDVVLIHDDILGTYAAHAGPCLVEPGIPTMKETWPDGKVYTIGRANPGYFAVSIATGPGHPATELQLASVVQVCAALYRFGMAHGPEGGWTLADVASRIVSHRSRAMWTPKYTQDRTRWGLVADAHGRTRKDDPEGPGAVPVMATASVARQVAALLTPPPVSPAAAAPPDADPFGFFRLPAGLQGILVPPPSFPFDRT